MAYNNLKAFRESLGLSQKEFAETLDLNNTTYNNYENGTREPKSDFLELIYNKYGISADYVLGLTNQMYIQKGKDPFEVFSTDALKIATAYDNADSGTQTAVRKLLDVSLTTLPENDETPPTTLQEALERHFEKERYRGGVAAFGGQSMSVELTKEQNEQLKELTKKYKDKL